MPITFREDHLSTTELSSVAGAGPSAAEEYSRRLPVPVARWPCPTAADVPDALAVSRAR